MTHQPQQSRAFCPECYAEIGTGLRCWLCGAKVLDHSTAREDESLPVQPNSEQRFSRVDSAPGLLSVLVLLLAVAFSLYLALGVGCGVGLATYDNLGETAILIGGLTTMVTFCVAVAGAWQLVYGKR